MGGVKSEWPLVVFTVCGPLCAGAWIVAAVFAVSDVFPQAGELTTGWRGGLICGLFVASLCCSTLHLGKPLKALRAFTRLGNSTVSNEVFIGALFALFSILYLVGASGLTTAGEIVKILLVFVAALAALFVLFQCLAYRMRTISTWRSFSFSVEFASIALVGGICLEGALACWALPLPYGVRSALVVVEAICCAGAVAVVCAQGVVVANSVSSQRGAHARLERWRAFSVVRVLAMLLGSIVWGCGMLGEAPAIVLVVAGMVMVVVGIAIGRFAFYRFYVSVGLPRG